MVIEKSQAQLQNNCTASHTNWTSTLTLEIDEFTTIQDIKRMVGSAMTQTGSGASSSLKADFIFDGRKLEDKYASAGSVGLQQGETLYMLMKPPRGKW